MQLTRDSKEFIALLNAHGVEYVMVGGWAFGFHSTPRYTGDLDFFLRCNRANAVRLRAALDEFGFGDLPGFEESFLAPERILQFGVPPNRIDILTEISGVTFEEAWAERVWGELGGVRLPIISRACLIRNKSAAGRSQDVADVKALTRTD